jgi:two-component system, cell cycle sensor histidine kinase and response regulator CckA
MNRNPPKVLLDELHSEVNELKRTVEREHDQALMRERKDHDERALSEASLRSVNRRLQMIRHCDQALIRAPDELSLLHTICKIAVEIGGYALAWVGFAEHDAEKSVRAVAIAGDSSYLDDITVTWSETPAGHGPIGTAIRNRAPSAFQNIEENPNFQLWRDAALKRGYASVCALPLITNDQVLGAIGIYSGASDAFDSEEVRLLSELATDLAFGISVLRAHQEHLRAEAALAASEERFKRLLQNSNDIIATLDEDFNYSSVGGPVENLLGWNPQELVGTSCTSSIHPEDIASAEVNFFQALKTPGAVRQLEYRVRHKQGRWIYLEAVGTNCLNDEVVRGIVLNIRDISARKSGEIERQHLQNQLQQAMKMEAVGRLAGGIAHDFNNLLTIIHGNVELAKLALDQGNTVLQNLDEVMRATQSAASLTRQLLSFSRRQIIEPRSVDLNQLVANLQKMLVRLIGEDIALQTQLEQGLEPVLIDPGQFEQVLVNLVVNARDAMPKGGRLAIETASVILTPEVCERHPDLRPGPFVRLTVTDSGLGMSEEVRLRLFEPFFTTKPKGKGTGLGLATIFGAVNQAGGAIEVESELDAGSTFRIYLPRSAEPVEQAASASPMKSIPTGHETVLLVEDDTTVRELASRMLLRLGYRTLVAMNGAEARALADGHEGVIDLLMTDIVMPDVNGKELAADILTRRPHLRVLYVSGYTEHTAFQTNTGNKPAHFISKPFSMQALARKIREVLGSKPA